MGERNREMLYVSAGKILEPSSHIYEMDPTLKLMKIETKEAERKTCSG